MGSDKNVELSFLLAKERYEAFGVDVEKAISLLEEISVSLHCWQGDDVLGFESPDAELTGGIASTGNYPGKARNADELRQDLDMALKLIPGNHRVNLHAIYAETNGEKIERNELLPEHFATWKDWAKEKNLGLDYNPTCFSHPMSEDGFTLSHKDESIRRFWVEHCIGSRKIGEFFGKELGTPCVTNIWVPDGYKDSPADRKSHRELLKQSLDTILAEKISPSLNLDAVEPKLFGIGSESYVVGSMEFYLGYAIKNNILLTLDSGHFHPTETISDKISSVLLFLDQILLHVSRGVRWDSDHVVTYTDDLISIAQEVVRSDALKRVHIGLDYFDGSINRVAAWTIGTRNTLKAFLFALLEPQILLRKLENDGDYTSRLAIMEENKWMPYNAVWEHYCMEKGVRVDRDYLKEIKEYEKSELSMRV